MQRIGVISDTHSLLRPEAIAALVGVDLIVHAGDIGSQDVIDRLTEIAPVKAVRGNVDKSPWADRYPETDAFEVDGIYFYVLHEIDRLDIDPRSGGFQVVISGHSHKPMIEWKDEVLFVNPGSAGPRRFDLPISLAILQMSNAQVASTMINLDEGLVEAP